MSDDPRHNPETPEDGTPDPDRRDPAEASPPDEPQPSWVHGPIRGYEPVPEYRPPERPREDEAPPEEEPSVEEPGAPGDDLPEPEARAPDGVSKAEPEARPQAEPEREPDPEREPEPESVPEPEREPEPEPEREPEPEPEPVPEPEPGSEPVSSERGSVAEGTEPPPEAETVEVEPAPPSRHGRRWKRIGGIAAAALVLLLLAGGAGAFYLYREVDSRIERTEVDVEKVAAPGGPVDILVVGSDSRAFVSSGRDAQRFGSAGEGERADTILLVQAVASEKRATIVSFPRDLYVEIPGRGMNRLNRAYSYGPQVLIDTVEELTGVGINHFVAVDFQGFRNLVDEIGGVTVCLPFPLRDPVLNFRLGAGDQHLDGDQALTFVRSRNGYPDGDFGRMRAQQDFLRAVVSKLGRPSVLLDPVKVHGFATEFADNVTTDSGFRLIDMVDLGRRIRSFGPDQLGTYSIPGEITSRGGASVVEMDEEGAAPIFRALRQGKDPLEYLDLPEGIEPDEGACTT